MGKRGKAKATRKKKSQQPQTSPPSPSPSSYSDPKQAASDFTVKIPDHLLSEILFRLPDFDSLSQCLTVCKRWISIITRPGFNCRFVQHLIQTQASDSSEDLPDYSLVLTYPHELKRPQHEDDPVTFKKLSRRNYIAATSDHLALMSQNLFNSGEHYWVCNMARDEWLTLPEPPISGEESFVACSGIVSKYKPGCLRGAPCRVDRHFSFKAVIIRAGAAFSKDASVYCSETATWSVTTIVAPPELNLYLFNALHPSMVAAGDGILNTLAINNERKVMGVVAIDLFNDLVEDPKRCYFIAVPSNFGSVKVEDVRLGTVGGRVRMAKFVKCNKGGFSLRIWELTGRVDWVLVHDARVHRKGCDAVVFLEFDPSDGNIVFFMRDFMDQRLLCQHLICENKYEICCDIKSLDRNRFIPECLRIFPHPRWLTSTYNYTPSEELEIISP